ncbi:MAG TPA: hypothetical protein V6C78_24085 [Crinalium sp.]
MMQIGGMEARLWRASIPPIAGFAPRPGRKTRNRFQNENYCSNPSLIVIRANGW